MAVGNPVRPSFVGKNGCDIIRTEGSNSSWTKWWFRPTNIPGLAVGDRLFAVIGLYKNTPETTVLAPPGWQLIINADYLRVYTKIATTDETWPELVALTKPQNVSFVFYNPKAGGLRPLAEFCEWYCYRNGKIIDSAVGVRHVPSPGADADPHAIPAARARYPKYSTQFSGEVSFRFSGPNYGANSIYGHQTRSRDTPVAAGTTAYVVGDRALADTDTSTPTAYVFGWPGTHVLYDSYHDFTIVMVGTTVPAKPGLRSPTNGATADLRNYTASFTWSYSSEDGSPQARVSFRRALVVSGKRQSYEYWNPANNSWSSGQVWFDDTEWGVNIPPGMFQNGKQYVWSVQVQSNAGVISPWSDDWTVFTNTAPVLTITDPPATITTFAPTVKWTVSDPEAEAQQWYEIVLVDSAALAKSGFNYQNPAGTAGAYLLWASGQVRSAATSSQLGVALHNHKNYTVFVRVNNGQNSPWDYQSFSLDLQAPDAPVLRVVVE